MYQTYYTHICAISISAFTLLSSVSLSLFKNSEVATVKQTNSHMIKTTNQNTVNTKGKQEQNWDSNPQPAVSLSHVKPIHHQDIHKCLRSDSTLPRKSIQKKIKYHKSPLLLLSLSNQYMFINVSCASTWGYRLLFFFLPRRKWHSQGPNTMK